MGGDRGGRGSGPAPLLFAYKKFLAEIMGKKLSCKFKYTGKVNERLFRPFFDHFFLI